MTTSTHAAPVAKVATPPMRLRLGLVFQAAVIIPGLLFGGVATAYLGGGFLESKLGDKVPGIHHLVNIIIVMLTFVMVIATALTLAERKWSALMQNRIGPNRARLPFMPNSDLVGIPHVITDVLKMLTKEDFIPKDANRALFNLGPILAFAPVFALFAIVPSGPTVTVLGKEISMVSANPDFGLLYLFGIASLAVYGTSLAGWSSNNKFALLGGVRASSQMISYEVALGLSLVGMMIAFSTVRLAGADGMSDLQGAYLPGWSTHLFATATQPGLDVGIPQWGILLQPLGFIIFFAAAFAETKRAPFDVPEGESEIIGYFVEYSGMKFGLFMISEFVEVVVLSGVLIAIFFGGPYLPFGNEWLKHVCGEQQWLYGSLLGTLFWLKVVALCYVQLVIRWTLPRFRYDQIQSLGWKILLPVGLGNVFVSGALILWDPSLHWLAIVGVLEMGVLVALTLTPQSAKSRSDAHIGHHGPQPRLGHGGGEDHEHGHAVLPAGH